MATESSAVVRFINLAQQAQNPVRPTSQAPITSEFGTEIVRNVRRPRPSRAPLIVIGAIVLAGGAAAGGVYLGKNGLGGSDGPKRAAAPAAAAAVTAPTAADPAGTQPAAGAVQAPAPNVTSQVVGVPSDVLAATGFDIRVEPPATITLDGSVLGKAPLRVRNLQPGAHVVDIEAPPGFFSRRVELALGAGEAKELKVSLDAIEEDAPVVTAGEPEAKPKAAKRSRADARRERQARVRQEQERKKEMRAARAAAARAARNARKEAPVVAEPLPDEPRAKAQDDDPKMSKADAELEAAMADIVGKPAPRRSTAAAAGASSLAASEGGAGSPTSGEKGTLMLGSKPPCDIVVDGKPTGLKTPQRAMELSPGTHRVTLVNKELGLEKKFKVKIAPGKTTKAIQDLTSDL